MKLFSQTGLIVLLLFTLACHQGEHATVTTKKVEATPKAEYQPVDIQTLTENHQVLLIRVAGDLSKVSGPTKSRITTLTSSFNTALEQFKSAALVQADLDAKLKFLEASSASGAMKSAGSTAEVEELTGKLNAATLRVEQTQGEYEELARQFAQLIEAVKKERGF